MDVSLGCEFYDSALALSALLFERLFFLLRFIVILTANPSSDADETHAMMSNIMTWCRTHPNPSLSNLTTHVPLCSRLPQSPPWQIHTARRCTRSVRQSSRHGIWYRTFTTADRCFFRPILLWQEQSGVLGVENVSPNSLTTKRDIDIP